MASQELRITIDANGNIHRELVERPQNEPGKPGLLKKLLVPLKIRTAALDNR